MAKQPTRKKPTPKRETRDEREQREWRARLSLMNRHAAAISKLIRQLDRAIDRNDRELVELAAKLIDRMPRAPGVLPETTPAATDASQGVAARE